ncbi:peptidase [Tropicimonas aquimaris]|uniref:Peptidase n=1 Tax=Tropicimonas aquimaris TaxID=914152 RepID=A0ABW3ILI8_9RHOB
MTYCVGLRMKRGLVFMSDTRTNAGVDNISTFRKMHSWCVPGERLITLMTAGNLATTQAVVSVLEERSKAIGERNPSILEQPSMFQVARLVGATLREVISEHSQQGQAADSAFGATIIVGGQIDPGPPRLFMIYSEGNFIEASEDTPFFQIGETKYGRPMLLRGFSEDLTFPDAIKLLLVSFDSTLKANLSVGMPFDLQTYVADSYQIGHEDRITRDNPYYNEISEGWGRALRDALGQLPPYDMD